MFWRSTLAVTLTVLLAIGGAALAQGGGHTLEQIQNAGWDCVQAGPHDWYHCSQEPILSQMAEGAESITVKVYDDETHEFIKTELLLREDLYAGQPCPTEGAEHWHHLGFAPYYACHH